MRDFHGLEVWRKAHELTLLMYRATQSFPLEERYGLARQLRDASSSIPTNIAEGCGRDSNREFLRFLRIACGSASEVEYELLLARDLSDISAETEAALQAQVVSIRRMLRGLIKRFHAE